MEQKDSSRSVPVLSTRSARESWRPVLRCKAQRSQVRMVLRVSGVESLRLVWVLSEWGVFEGTVVVVRHQPRETVVEVDREAQKQACSGVWVLEQAKAIFQRAVVQKEAAVVVGLNRRPVLVWGWGCFLSWG